MSSYDYVIPKYGGDLARNNDDYKYEYEIFIALISQRNIRVQGSTSIKIYGYQNTTYKLKH